MQSQRKIEITVGIFIATGMAALVLLAMQVSNLSALSNDEGYTLTAKFDNIGGLTARSQITVAGVKIGRVNSINLNPDTHRAVVSMNISKNQKIPADSVASIYTAGLLGEQYISIVPGKADTFLKNGEEIKKTEPSVVLEKMIGDFFSRTNVHGFNNDDVYNVKARFANVGTVQPNTAVVLGGVTVGRVVDIRLDPTLYEAIATLAIRSDIKLPLDTSASIYSSSLIGGQYVGLEPGGEEDVLKDGDEIRLTQSAIVLEKLISEFLFNTASGDTGGAD